MPTEHTVLLVGGTGRTGRRVLQQLLARGVHVRAIVRSRGKLPAELSDHAHLTVIEASLLALPDEELGRHVSGCDAVISCLGHEITMKGIYGAPRDLVTQAMVRLCRQIEGQSPRTPVKVILMTSVSVHRPGGQDARRGPLERAFMAMVRGAVPPAKDNQKAADFLCEKIGQAHPSVEWVVVRPDSLLEGDISAYSLHEGLVSSVFSPARTNMANIAAFMCDLVTSPEVWARWKGRLPVIINTEPGAPAARPG